MSNRKERSDVFEKLITKDILAILLMDRTTGGNIIWATDDYSWRGDAYSFSAPIELSLISDRNGEVIRPRVEKDRDSQSQRSKGYAEVFTPSWVCNTQNNLIDDAWFGSHTNPFNNESDGTNSPITFPKDRTWQDYVRANRLEISCGEAPYLTSRYDAVTGDYIPVGSRVGLLDRKLRVIGENTDSPAEWIKWAKEALKAVYGYEWQGDNIFLARKNLLYTATEHYYKKFTDIPGEKDVTEFAEIISWNIFQMDGLKFVIPNSCKPVVNTETTLFGDTIKTFEQCPGCEKGDEYNHTGIYAEIMDWEEKKIIKFIELSSNRGFRYGTV